MFKKLKLRSQYYDPTISNARRNDRVITMIHDSNNTIRQNQSINFQNIHNLATKLRELYGRLVLTFRIYQLP